MDRFEGTIRLERSAHEYVAWTEESHWTAHSPAVPGVYGVGGTRDQAVADLGEALAALASYLDEIGESLPPSGAR